MSLDKRLTELFATFQEKDKNVVNIHDIPTIIRAIGLVPSDVEMQKIVSAMVGEESEDSVLLGAFLTVAKKLILDRRYLPNAKSELQTALSVIAIEGKKIIEMDSAEDGQSLSRSTSYGETKKFYPKGSLRRCDLVRLLTQKGNSLTQEEADELIVTLPLLEDDIVNTEAYSSQLVPVPHIL